MSTKPLAKARNEDPVTSHDAAEEINAVEGKLEQTIGYVAGLVSEFPGRSMGDIVDIHCLRSDEGSSAYGRLTTVFHHCEEAGLIRKNGKVRDPRTGKVRFVYVSVLAAERSEAKATYAAEIGARKKAQSVRRSNKTSVA